MCGNSILTRAAGCPPFPGSLKDSFRLLFLKPEQEVQL
nr:MAG TPA: hypothetical protein [Caudoviricetes sp.]